MKTYFYKRADGTIIRLEAEALFWSGTACVFVSNGSAAAVISLLPGEVVCEESATGSTEGTEPNWTANKSLSN